MAAPLLRSATPGAFPAAAASATPAAPPPDTCALPGCDRPAHVEADGTVHACCGRTHSTALSTIHALNAQAMQTEINLRSSFAPSPSAGPAYPAMPMTPPSSGAAVAAAPMSYHEIRAAVAALDPSMGLRDTIAPAIRRTGLPVSPASGGKHKRTKIMIIDEMRAAVGLPELNPPMGIEVRHHRGLLLRLHAPPPLHRRLHRGSCAACLLRRLLRAACRLSPQLVPRGPASNTPVVCDDFDPLAERLAAAAADRAANASRIKAQPPPPRFPLPPSSSFLRTPHHASRGATA